ncbi:MAG: hypothetical protein HYW65_00520 [Candidatus Liptonbacteria bacterium]|nr:hypothetical protein [Candidatus Liptonbacteria bacterium]
MPVPAMDISKFYAKLAVITTRALLLRFMPVRPNREGWEGRMLLINLDFIGDLVMFTAVLKHYRRACPGKTIFVLINSASGMSPLLLEGFADEVLTLDAEAFRTNAWYGYRFIAKLRRIGFATVAEHNPAMEFIGRTIAVELGAERVFGYEGLAFDRDVPPSRNAELGTRYFDRVLSKKFTKVIPRITERISPRYLTHMIAHHAAIFEGVTGREAPENLAPELPRLPSDETIQGMLRKEGVKPYSYALIALGASSFRKEWPPGKFAELGKVLVGKAIPIVLTGGKRDVPGARAFAEFLGSPCIDLVGKTSILDVVSLVRYSLITVSNDTAPTHFAVALKRPSLTIMYPTRPGWAGPYGYRDINRWVIREDVPCFGDNGQCGNAAGPGVLAPCIAAVTVEDAKKELVPLLAHITSGVPYPATPFLLFAK